MPNLLWSEVLAAGSVAWVLVALWHLIYDYCFPFSLDTTLVVAGYWQLAAKSLKWLPIGLVLSSTLVSVFFSAPSQAKCFYINLCRKLNFRIDAASKNSSHICQLFNDINFCRSFKGASTKYVTELQISCLSLRITKKTLLKAQIRYEVVKI